MSLRVKPAKTQIVRDLRMMYEYTAEKLCKKVAFSLRKPTALFRKMGTRIFFLEQPLVIRKIRVPLCSNVRNLFVEQSAPSLIPRQNRISSVYEDRAPWNISRNAPQNARKKAVLAPFAPFYSTYLFVEQCSTNVPRNSILCSTMIIN